MKINYDKLTSTYNPNRRLDLTYVIDVSASMSGAIESIRKHLNKSLKKQRKTQSGMAVETYVTVLSFSEGVNVLRLNQPLDTLPPLKRRELLPESCTALYDATKLALEWAEDRSGGLVKAGSGMVNVSIFTDGQENASETTKKQMMAKVNTLKKRNGWVIDLWASDEVVIRDFEDIGFESDQLNHVEVGEEKMAIRGMDARISECFKTMEQLRVDEEFSKSNPNWNF